MGGTLAKVMTLTGTRPDIIKLSPLVPLLTQSFDHTLVHSGQHFSREMQSVFFEELRLPSPKYNLEIGLGSQTKQIASVMTGLEEILLKERPDALIVFGGSSTALAGALVGAKLNVRVAHIEAGTRTGNQRAPEETNRALIDRLANWLFAPDEIARGNLVTEGLPDTRVHVIGSTTVDACQRNLHLTQKRSILSRLNLVSNEYITLTLHRAENTEKDTLSEIVSAVNALSRIWPIVFPIHPRTQHALGEQAQFDQNVKVINPLGHLDMLKLISDTRVLLTDSCGLQEEALVVGTPALIMRNETEWTAAIEAGANALVGNSYKSMMDRAWPLIASDDSLKEMRRRAVSPPGGAAVRIVRTLERDLNSTVKTPFDPSLDTNPALTTSTSTVN